MIIVRFIFFQGLCLMFFISKIRFIWKIFLLLYWLIIYVETEFDYELLV